MTHSSHVPKFGSWGKGDEVPNYTVYFDKAREDRVGGKMINPNDPQQYQDMFINSPGTRTEPDQEPIRKGVQAQTRRVSRGDGEFMQVSESAARNENMGGRSAGGPGKSKMKPANRYDETPERGAAVPKFGEWDESNPASADNFTGIFQRVREERHHGPGRSPGHVGAPSSYSKSRNLGKDTVKCCCFPLGRK